MVIPKRTVPLAVPSLGPEERAAVVAPLESGWVAQGPEVAAFEQAFARMHGVEHAIACSSGTAALHLILAGIGIGPGDEVLVPSFTWIASANAVRYTGATPVLVDVDLRTYNVGPQHVVEHINGRTRAIMAVHLFGLCADVDGLRAVAPEVAIVEDAACAAGGSLAGRSAGGLGVAAAFSFHPRKTITTGEGGMVTTSDATLADRIRSLRNHGAAAPVGGLAAPHAMARFPMLGFNYRMTDMQGAIGRVQLDRLPGFIEERRRMAARYQAGLSDLDWLTLPAAPDAHTYQSYVCLVDEAVAGKTRNAMMDALAEQGIATRPGTHAVHRLEYYQALRGPSAADLPGATQCDACTIAIPMHNELSDEDQDYVIERIRDLV